MNKLILWMSQKAALAAGFLLVAAVVPAGPEPVGGPLDGAIISVYVSENKPSNPCAATAQTLYAYDDEGVRWVPIYKTPANDPILDVAGAAGSSKHLMVAHKTGVARSKDAGKTWDEFTPAGWSQLVAEGGVQLAVNPENRKEAVAASHRSARVTSNDGSKWTTINVGSKGGEILGLAYAGEESLFAATSTGGSTTADRGANWKSQYEVQGKAPSIFALSTEPAYVYTVAGDKLRGLHLGGVG